MYQHDVLQDLHEVHRTFQKREGSLIMLPDKDKKSRKQEKYENVIQLSSFS